ncbi:MAG: prepilin peptidase [bacterium]
MLLLAFLLGFFLSIPFIYFIKEESIPLKMYLNTMAISFIDFFTIRKRNTFYKQLIIGSISGFIMALICEKILIIDLKSFLLIIVFELFSLALLYLAVYDFTYFEIPTILSLFVLILLIGINIVLIISGGLKSEYLLFGSNFYIPFNNIVAGIGAAMAIFLIVFFSKGKGMGSGDIILAGIMGLCVGMPGLIVGFYATILSASVIGLAFAARKGHIKGLKIPFVPFIVFGIIFAFLYSDFIISLLPMYY